MMTSILRKVGTAVRTGLAGITDIRDRDRLAFAGMVVGVLVLVAGIGAILLSRPSLTTIFHLVVTSGLLAALGFGIATFSRRRSAEREQDLFVTLIESVRDSVIRYDADGKVSFLSHSSETLFGCRRYELDGNGLLDRVHVMDRPAYLTALAAATRDGHSQTVEIRMRRDGADAGYRWIELGLSPVAPEGQGPCEVVAVLRDVTARREADEALERARAAAEEASEAKTRFLATIGHELRTPLNAIVGFSDMMQAGIGGTLSPGHHEYAGLIRQSGDHLLEIINMLLDISKIEAGKFELSAERFDPAVLAVPCLQLVQKAADDRGISLALEVAEDLPEILADERACRQILINLLSNAVKFSHDGGTVILAIKRQGASIAFTVKDAGIGMSAHTVRRLGEPFYQAQNGLNRHYEGTGLGLSIVKGLVALHEGRLHVTSTSGEGTKVTVHLPIAGPGAIPSADIEPLRIDAASHTQSWPDRKQRSAAR